jgi:hypothetical protein
MSGVTKSRFALCWDCYHATNPEYACSWSARLEPVPGWEAELVSNKGFQTYLVRSCPLFDQDALNSGTVRLERKEVKK